MVKNIIIVGLSIVALVGGLWMAVEKNKAEVSESVRMLEKAAKDGQKEETKPASPAVKTEEEIQAEEWKKTWMDKYQIGASHPNSYDPKTFVPVDEFYAKDKNNAYLVNISSENKARSFQTIYRILIIPGADPGTFESAKYPYSKDGKSVYYYEKRIVGADPESFVSLMFGYAKDKQNGYYEGKKISGADASSFVWINGYYVKDIKHVYYQASIMKSADVATFMAENARETYDKNYNYYDGKIKDKRQN